LERVGLVDVYEISAVVAAAGVLAGVVYYILDMRNQSRMRHTEIETRQANLFMQIYAEYYKEDFLTNLNEVVFSWNYKDFDFWQKYGPLANPKAFARYDAVGSYFKGIGVLLKKNLIDLNLVDELMGTSIMKFWEKFESYIKEFRVREWSRSMEGVEYLYNELKKREQKLQAEKS
jgi:hypothetical protein